MVKKIFLICICSGFICFLCVACRDRDVAKSFPEDISGTAVSGNYPIVVDETGKERELKLGDVDVEDKGVGFGSTYYVGEYSQVVKGHYYYLRNISTNKYGVYRDQGECECQFTLPDESSECYVREFAKLGKEYYALLCDDYDLDNIVYQLVCIDAKKGTSKVLSESSQDFFINSMAWYKGAFYYKRKGGTVVEFGNGHKNFREMFHMHSDDMGNKLLFLDGKIYYGSQLGNEISLYSFDLKKGTREEVFRYERKGKIIRDMMLRKMLDIDEDYIYISNDMIPRKGGEILRLGDGCDRIAGDIAHNKKYVFYCDGDYRLHRLDKGTKKDIIISGIKAMNVNCTEDGIYVQGYNKFYASGRLDSEEEDTWHALGDYSFDLYYMDLDGRHKKRIWKGNDESYAYKGR